MLCRLLLPLLLHASLPAAAAEPVTVMILGTFHMSNPGRDMHDVQVDDVLAPKRQAEIADIIKALSRFHPTKVMTEWPADLVAQRYAAFESGTLAPSHNEVVQLGFRLAAANKAQVAGIDVDGDFPFEPVQNYAKAHGQEKLLAGLDAGIVAQVRHVQSVLQNGTISQALRAANDRDTVAHGNDFYRSLLLVGGGTEQPGADLFTAWAKRNFQICANLVQRARPGDRIVVIYGYGHEVLLRQCVSEMPGYRLIEANDYLPE